jgi:hypothetical protein
VAPSTDRSIGAGSVPECLQRATPGSDWAVLLSLMGTLSHFDVIPPRNIEMTPLCKVEVTLPRVSGSREVRRAGGVHEQARVQSA